MVKGYYGCYWCKYRKGFKCKLDNRIDLQKILARLNRLGIETTLSWIITEKEDRASEGQYIGEDCCVKKEPFIFR